MYAIGYKATKDKTNTVDIVQSTDYSVSALKSTTSFVILAK